MAADLIMPTVASGQDRQPYYDSNAQQQQHLVPQRPQHARSYSYQAPPNAGASPISSADNRHNSSASSSPRSHYARQQQQGRPLYMPAVLRPNYEFPQKPATRRRKDDSDTNSVFRSSINNTIVSLPSLAMFSQRVSRRPTADSGKDLSADWDLEAFPEVTAQPTRRHWKPDIESTTCDDPACKRNFSYFIRRHHCRRCGNVFCDWHSSYVSPLDQDANFNPRALPSRTCNYCFAQFKAWHSRASSAASSDVPHTTPSSPIATFPGHNAALAPDRMVALVKTPDAAASVPSDWNWSTF